MKPPSALEPPHEERPTEALSSKNEPGLYPDLDLDHAGPTKNYWWVWLIVFGLIAYGCYELYQSENARKADMSAKKGMKGPRSVPVVTATARAGDMPVYLQGLGTVTPFNSVIVKPRVDGQLISVNFREGQEVHKGDLLARTRSTSLSGSAGSGQRQSCPSQRNARKRQSCFARCPSQLCARSGTVQR
jgi:multidrug efflux pump subunit AcrA (membrane-fusion protein)